MNSYFWGMGVRKSYANISVIFKMNSQFYINKVTLHLSIKVHKRIKHVPKYLADRS